MIYIEVKALAGISYIRASDILAVQFNEPQRCTVVMTGGVTVPCSEAAKDIVARIEAATPKTAAEPKDKS
jgi:hypothetical protein